MASFLLHFPCPHFKAVTDGPSPPRSAKRRLGKPPGVAVVVSKMKSKQWVDLPLLAWKAFFHSCSTEVFSKHQGWLQVKLSKSQIFSAENNKLPGNL